MFKWRRRWRKDTHSRRRKNPSAHKDLQHRSLWRPWFRGRRRRSRTRPPPQFLLVRFRWMCFRILLFFVFSHGRKGRRKNPQVSRVFLFVSKRPMFLSIFSLGALSPYQSMWAFRDCSISWSLITNALCIFEIYWFWKSIWFTRLWDWLCDIESRLLFILHVLCKRLL